MSDSSTILILEQACDEAIDWAAKHIIGAGLRVVRTFDLHEARNKQGIDYASCPCPHHGTEQCDCQMVVLLVYGVDRQPVSIVAHGHHGQTWFSLVNTLQQRADPILEAAIRQSLVPQDIKPLFNQTSQSHAT